VTTSTRPVPAKKGIAISNDEEPGTEGSYAGPVLALLDDRARTERILDRLEVTEDLTERADLASELVRPPLDTNTSSNGRCSPLGRVT